MGHRTDKSRTEDLTTDQRAYRHPDKSASYTEDSQGVKDDNVDHVQGLREEDLERSRNKANAGKEE